MHSPEGPEPSLRRTTDGERITGSDKKVEHGGTTKDSICSKLDMVKLVQLSRNDISLTTVVVIELLANTHSAARLTSNLRLISEAHKQPEARVLVLAQRSARVTVQNS